MSCCTQSPWPQGSPADSGFCSEMSRTLEFPDSWCHRSPAPVSRGTVTTPRWGPGPGARWSRPWGPWTRPCAPSCPRSARTLSWTWRSGPEGSYNKDWLVTAFLIMITPWLIPGACQRTPCWTWWCVATVSVSEMINVFYPELVRGLCPWPCPQPDWHNPIPDYKLQVINIQTGDETALCAFIFIKLENKRWSSLENAQNSVLKY